MYGPERQRVIVDHARSRGRVEVAALADEFDVTAETIVAAARRVVVLADHTKVGNDFFARFAWLDDVDTFVTDDGLDSAVADELEANGPRVVRA